MTLLLSNESRFASQLVQSLGVVGQEVPKPLFDLAMKDPQFRKGSSRSKGGKWGGKGGGRRPKAGGAGLGFSGPGTKAAASGGDISAPLPSAPAEKLVQSPAINSVASARAEMQQQSLQASKLVKKFVSSGTTGGDIGALTTAASASIVPHQTA